MTTDAPSLRWLAADTYARAHQLSPDEVIAQIHAGRLTGLLSRHRWYVIDRLVTIEIPDPDHPEHARLHIAGIREGNWITAGNGSVVLEVTYDGETRQAIGDLCGPGNVRPAGPITVTLGGEELLIDVPLQAELLDTLIEWQIEVELGDLLDAYRPDGLPTH